MESRHTFSGFGYHGNHYYGTPKGMVLKNKVLASMKTIVVNYTLVIILY